MSVFDPFAGGAATEVTDKPVGFDPFAAGQAQAHARAITSDQPEVDSSPQVGNRWPALYGGLEGMDQRLMPDERKAFSALDLVSDNSKSARAQAINQAYIQSLYPKLPHSLIERNWEAIRTTFAQQQFGMVDHDVTDTTLYGKIAKRVAESQDDGPGEIKAWTWKDQAGSDVYQVKKAVSNFWEGITKSLITLPDPPDDLPEYGQMGPFSPATAAGIYKGLKPLVEGLSSPLSMATVGGGGLLADAAKTYPAAKAALVGMTGVFTGLMGYGTVQSEIAREKVFKDPNSSHQDKVAAGVNVVGNAGATVLGALGMALELWPGEKQAEIVKEMQGKNPAEGAAILRREAADTDTPGQSDFLNDAAHELDRIATEKDKAGVKQAAKAEKEAPPPTETLPEPQIAPETSLGAKEQPSTNLIGIKNEAIDAELEKMGLPPATHGEKVTFKGVMEDAASKLREDSEAGTKLVNELDQKPRPVSGEEDALLLQEQNRLRIARDQAQADLLKARQAGDVDAVARAEQDVARNRDAFAKASDVVTKVGTKNAQGLALRRMMINEDYSLAAMEMRQRVANAGRPLSREQQTQVEDLHRQLTEAQAKIDAYEKARQEAKAAPIWEAPRRPKPPSKVQEFISKQAEQARARLKQKMTSGRVSSGIDPTDIADHAIIGAEYIAKGVTKFADWSTAMVNELGEVIRPYLHQIFKEAIAARDQATKLQAYKSRLETGIAGEKVKLMAENLPAREARKAMVMDKEATKLRAEYERVKRKVQLEEQKLELKNRTPLQKAASLVLKIERAGILSRVGIIVKLSAIIAERSVMTPIRQGIGLAVSKIMPGVAAQARFEDVPSVGGFVRSEAKAFTAMLTKGLPGAWDILRMKDTDLQALLEKEHLPPGVLSFPTHVHAALHYPIQVEDYARRLSLINERDIRAGVDMSEPVNQLRNMTEAYQYSKRSVFMQDNKVVNGYKAMLKTWESKDKTGAFSPVAKALAFGLQAELPIVKIPVNVAGEITEHVAGLMDPPMRRIFQGTGGFKDLTYGEADMILRHVKNGSLGAGLLLLGFFKYKQVGGFYQAGEHRKKADVQPGEVRVGGSTVPQIALKDTSMEVLMAGATLHRTLDSVYRLSDPQKKGIPAALLAASVGIAEITPFVKETTVVGKLLDPRQQEHVLAQDVASKLVPGFLQEIAAQLDKKIPFSPMESPRSRKITAPSFGGALKQEIQKGLPGERKKLPQRDVNTTFKGP
jgi:hypothetical protein